MANKKMSRVISILAVLAMLAMLVPTVAFAANTVEMTTVPTYNKDQGTIEVAGTISGDATDNADITMMAIRSDAPLSEIPDSIISDSNCIMYIDQKPANPEKSASWTFKLRDNETTGDYVTVFMGGTDVDTYVYESVCLVNLDDPGTPVMIEADTFSDGDQVLDLSGMDANWASVASIGVYDGETLVGNIDPTTGVVALDNAPDTATEYTIKFGDVEGFAPIADMTATFIDADAAKLAEYDGEAAWGEHGADAEAWTISIPEGTDDVAITVTGTPNGGDAEDKAADVIEGILSVPRTSDDDIYPYVVTVTATAGAKSKVLGTFSVKKFGAAAAIDAADVEVFAKNNAYGINGGKLIKVVAADVDSATQFITVAGATLYYSPDKEAFYGVVTAEALGKDVTKDAIAEAAEISDGASAVFYFGKAGSPTTPRGKVTALDVATAKKIVLKASTPTVDVYLASDVSAAEPDGNITALDVSMLKKTVLSGATLPVVAPAEQ